MESSNESKSAPEAAKERILRAAREEFAAAGLGAASVHTIGKRAGVTGAMINYYFGGKRGLYDAVLADAQGRLLERLSGALAGAEREGLPARLATAYFDFLAEERELQRLLLRQVLDHDEGAKESSARFLLPLGAMLDEHFGGGEAALQDAISLFGAVSGYFIYEPLLGELLGRDPLSEKSLAKRRKHVAQLASMFERKKR
jgi:AcrR family transcriptional regulator